MTTAAAVKVLLVVASVTFVYTWYSNLLVAELHNIRAALRGIYALMEHHFGRMHAQVEALRDDAARLFAISRSSHSIVGNNSAKLDEIRANVERLLGERW